MGAWHANSYAPGAAGLRSWFARRGPTWECMPTTTARCAIFDERGEAVAAERLFLLAARSRLEEYGEGTVVAPAEWTAGLGPRVTALGGRLIAAEPSAAAIAEAMRSHGAVFGASGDGALWHRIAAGIAAPDGLRTITLVLEQLSRSDRPLSAVLDAEAAAE